MRRLLVRAAAVALALLAAAGGAGAATAPYVDGHVMVRWKPAASASARLASRASVVATPLAAYPIIEGELLQVPPGTVEGTVARLSADPNVVWAEPDYVWHADATPNDPLFPQDWALHNTGQTGGTPGADIHATEAWDIFTGDSTLLIGIIDTGADYTHPDLAANVWTNPGEIPGNGIDDDGDGYVDDVHGYDFHNNDGDPMDDNGHGTHVSGTIAAVGDNGLGIAGICWRAKLVLIKFLGADGSGTSSGAVSAFQYARTVGVRLTNNSWGGPAFSQAVLDAIDAVGAAGQLVVAAAGNAASNNDVLPTYPASYDRPFIISVAATDANDRLASFSNFGPNSVDLAAPGTNIVSLAPGGGTRTLSGTSMATPHVTGVAALMMGRFPSLGAVEIKQRLVGGVDTLASLAGLVRSGGRLNAVFAIANPDSIPPGPIPDLAVAALGSNFVTLTWTATGDDSTAGRAAAYDIRLSTAPLTAANFDSARAVPGPDPAASGAAERFEVDGLATRTTYWLALRAIDKARNRGPVSDVVVATTLGPPGLGLAPDSLAATLNVGATTTLPLAVSNTAEGTLDWTVPLPELAFAAQASAPEVKTAKGESGPVNPPQTLARGGPDAFGYRWVDSDEIGGPAFAWAGADSNGTLVPLAGDDVNSAPLDLGFEFPFYGARYTQVVVCTNGYLTFADAAPAFSNQPLPSNAAPPALIAPFWDDLDFGASYRVWTRAEPDRFVVEWLAVPHYALGGPYTFEAILLKSGEIRFQYGALGDPLTSATVGLQSPDRSAGLQVAFNAPYLHDSLAIRMAPVPQWVTVSPAAGRVDAGAAQNVNVSFDATGLLAGTFRGSVVVHSNDPLRPTGVVPVRLDVHGAPDIALRPATLAFDTVLVGGSATRAVTVLNQGTDSLHVTAIDPGDPAVTAGPTAFALAPGQSMPVSVTWTPGATGPLAATLVVTSDDPDSPREPLPLTGVAAPAPVVTVAPDSLSEALSSSQTFVRYLTLHNQGQGTYTFAADAVPREGAAAAPARAALAAAAAKPGAVPAGSGGPDAFGYTWRDSNDPGGPAFAWEDVRAFGLRLPLSGDDAQTGPVPIGFDFPFFGATFRSLHVCTNGWVSLTDSTLVTAINTPLPSAAAGTPANLIAAFWDDLVFGPERRCWVESDSTHCVIQYQEVPRFGAGEVGHPNTFEIVLHADGTIEYRYLAVRAAVLTSATVGIQNATRDDGVQVVFNAPYLQDSLAVRFRPPLRWLTVTPSQGVVPAGGSLDLMARFDATAMFGGTYLGAVRIAGNDPVRPVVEVPCALTVSGVPEVAVSPESLDFGITYVGWPQTRVLRVINAGTDSLRVGGISSGDPRLLADPPKFTVAPLGSRDVAVTFAPAGEGTLAGSLALLSNDPHLPRVAVAAGGQALPPPSARAAPGAIAAAGARGTVAAAGTLPRSIFVANTGASPLHWTATARIGPSIEGADPPLEQEAPKGAPSPVGALGNGGPDPFGYAWTDSDEPQGPVFAWVPPGPDARDLNFFTDDATAARIPLPFAFPFYGRPFSTVNVCTNGWLSFTSTLTTYTNTTLPNAGVAVPENLIAAFWDDLSFDPSVGIGHVTWDTAPDGRFVVTFTRVARAAGGGPYTFQVLLAPSGDIDVQYLSMGAPLTSATVGIQDSTRTMGLQVVANAGYVHDRLRVRIARVDPWLALTRDQGTVAPGARDTLGLLLRAVDRDSASFRGEVRVTTDDPAHPVLSVPCSFEVALQRAAMALPPPPLSAALGGDTLRAGVGPGVLAHPLAGWIGDVPAAPRPDGAGGWTFAFPLYAARATGAALAVAVEDSARAWVVSADSVRVPAATVRSSLHALGSGLDSARVAAGAPLALDWDDPPADSATSWHVWLATDGGHVWRPLALGLTARSAVVTLPGAPSGAARLEVTGMRGGQAVWSWISDAFVIAPGVAPPPLAFGLRLAGPNPAAGSVALEVALPAAAAVTLEVLAVRGARVRRVAPQLLPAGRHALVWDGLDGAGRRAPPGLYFVRASGGGAQAIRRVVLLR